MQNKLIILLIYVNAFHNNSSVATISTKICGSKHKF